ncbi:MAG: RloB family protein, partial [Erysipelotrichaceae bacterium]|nr:RloB family protein [Erysipelotrichaceae bacterium]
MKRKFEDKKRDTLTRKRKPLMFISLEGNNKTEKLYLKALNKDNNKYALIFTPGRESDPINMHKSLKKTIKESFNEDDGDKAYCICDRDFEIYKLDKLMKIRQDKTTEKKISVIVSNPCFEIWYLNHFIFYTKEMMSYKELEKTLCKYID